jgi:hypothetical protein
VIGFWRRSERGVGIVAGGIRRTKVANKWYSINCASEVKMERAVRLRLRLLAAIVAQGGPEMWPSSRRLQGRRKIGGLLCAQSDSEDERRVGGRGVSGE